MFNPNEPSKKDKFLEQAKSARQERAFERKCEEAAVCIQRHVRGFTSRRNLGSRIRKELDDVMKLATSNDKSVGALEVYKAIKRELIIFDEELDKERFEHICKYIVSSIDTDNMKFNYISTALSKDNAVEWILQVKIILTQSCKYLQHLKPELPHDAKLATLYLHILVSFTAPNNWKILKMKTNEGLKAPMNQLCANLMGHLVQKGLYQTLQILLIKGLGRTKPVLKQVTISAIITLALRPLISAQFSDNLLTTFVVHILSVPALIHHLQLLSPECLTQFSTHELFKHSLDLLISDQNVRIIFNMLEGNYALCLLANLIHLGSLETEVLSSNLLDFANVTTRLMESCQKYVRSKRSNLAVWHPVLGWFEQRMDHSLNEAMPFIKSQLQILWSFPMIRVMFQCLLESVATWNNPPVEGSASTSHSGPSITSQLSSPTRATNFLRKAFEKASNRSSNLKFRKLGSPETTIVALICSLYQLALDTFTQLKLDILTGLCYQDLLLPNLWKFIHSLGSHSCLNAFLDHLAINTKTSSPEFQMLTLFCGCATHLITILDDIEMYEQQKPFSIEDLRNMAVVFNQFIFKAIWNNLIDIKMVNSNALVISIHTLLMLLYQRDCRKNYMSSDQWLIKEIKGSSFMNDVDRGKKSAQILLQKRVLLFRKHVANEKAVLGLTECACASPQSTLITVHRRRIVEDGYRQLAALPPQSLKGVIRVKFINEQGLDEAGIDQDGVFKEFLEETIKQVFDPSLNLFKVTSEERLYPSPTSSLHDNHLQLFEFIGRMLGKAVYEVRLMGIVVDVPFASFFLSQVLGQQHSAFYSSIDELPSLDPELYRSLTYIKHYDGNILDLDLTFSCDDDYMGSVVSHELVPGGKAIAVTNENKISYIHLMAHFRMHMQIRDQTANFIRGFRSIINSDWLSIFSTPEVQRLISGDNTEIDLEDMRRHTQYYGGFHDNHRVICWLWDVLEKEFTVQERRLFLKFVTSCSKSPLLGFAHLEPPFSIRCVEVSDDQDTGDTVGSVLRGFFTIRKKDPVNRLPTSSTCFNLLKLPNYQHKATLKKKLRYAITSNTGFELS
uniref:Ubiquitin-protein ligase E3B n=1 Tax=Strigamia maritima TaxID=126957 RepID=T1IRU6_STRMM